MNRCESCLPDNGTWWRTRSTPLGLEAGARLALCSTDAQHRIDNLANKNVPINSAFFAAVPDA
ncbi:hypothetical protein [Bradyrhizobium sp. CB3481]|uniref:hypothetical protein n=1 Tax=Bradyrhizobium sp. CB3481 TaxID=3039158 RepID=UPI0024B16D3F|nr:hypothetical protein [Bradyrhizobium sp. CB3481]WFU19314.1 hypothetical protein QA643_13645 [Bradyrhizobium sp. CB3481]